MTEKVRLVDRPTKVASWVDRDLVWLGLLLSVISAVLVVALVWWLVS